MLASVFSEGQMHRMSSFDLRKQLFFGQIESAPFSKLGHWLLYVSTFEACLLLFAVQDPNILKCLIVEKLCIYLILIEIIVWLVFKIPSLIMAHVPALVETLHSCKKLEAKIHNKLCKRKIKIVKIEKQPYVQGGMIRCGDPNCKMMHKDPAV